MKALFEKIIAEIHALDTCAADCAANSVELVARFKRHFLDHVGGELDAAKVLAFMARERFEDAASRGFPNNNAVELKANAIAAQAHADSLDIAAVSLPKRPRPASTFDGPAPRYTDLQDKAMPAHPAEPLVADPVAAASGIVIPQLDETAGTATTGFLAVSAAQADADAETTPPPPVADGAIAEPAPEAPEQVAALPEPAGE